jgi:hypothetical protein
MASVNQLRSHIKVGKVYRRAELAKWSNSVDRHLAQLTQEGTLEKLSPGLYHAPKKTVFGNVPPDEETLVRKFLKDDDFLVTSPNAYNSLGVGTTQLYNKRVVYNHKRHGEFILGGRKFFFHTKHKFPKSLTQEFLLVDLVNNLESLAEDRNDVLEKVLEKAKTMNVKRVKQAVSNYGGAKARALFSSILTTDRRIAHA